MFTRTAFTAFALTLLVAPRVARANEPTPATTPPDKATSQESPRANFDAEPAVALPMGDRANATGPALGGLIGGSYGLSDRWELVSHAGYLAGAATSTQVAGVSVSSSVSYAPLLGGVRYYLVDPGNIRPYAMAEAGVVLVSVSSSASATQGSASDSGSSVYLGGAASLGLLLDVVDVRAALMTADLGHAGSSTSALLSLGFRFAEF
jgi:hypothetical protein